MMSSSTSALSSFQQSSIFPPIQYWSLLEETTTTAASPWSDGDDSNGVLQQKKEDEDDGDVLLSRVSTSIRHEHNGESGVVDGVIILTIQQPQQQPLPQQSLAKEEEEEEEISASSFPPPLRYRILLQRKLRHTGTGGDIYVGFVLQGDDGHVVTTADNQVQMVHVRMESTTTTTGGSGSSAAHDEEDEQQKCSTSCSSSSLWVTTIDPGFRALQWLIYQLLLLVQQQRQHAPPPPPPPPAALLSSVLPPPRMMVGDNINHHYHPPTDLASIPFLYYRLDLSTHLLLAKNDHHAVCVTPRRANTVSLADYLASTYSLYSGKDDQENVEVESNQNELERFFVLTEDSVRHLFRDVITGLKTLHGLGVCHRNINMDTILVMTSSSSLNNSTSNDDKNDDNNHAATTSALPRMCALVSGLESCRSIEEAHQGPSVNQTPQCVPPEVWKGTMVETTFSSSCSSWFWKEQQQQDEEEEPAAAELTAHDQKQDEECDHQYALRTSPMNDDLWAAGVVLSVLLLKTPLFNAPLAMDMFYQRILHAADEATTAAAIVTTNPDVDDAAAVNAYTTAATTTPIITTRFPLANNAALELMRAMLAENPKDRLTLEQIMDHAWLVPLSSSEPLPPPQ